MHTLLRLRTYVIDLHFNHCSFVWINISNSK